MEISGFQKLSLLDFPATLASIVFTQGCNFRCIYCHNPELLQIKKGLIPEEEVLSYLESKKYFLGGVVITGGEPTLQEDLPSFCMKIKSLGLNVKLDTNGSNPGILRQLTANKLVDYFAMDLKAPWEKYPDIIKKTGYQDLCKESMEIIRKSGVEYIFRTTVLESHLSPDDADVIRSYLLPGENLRIQEVI